MFVECDRLKGLFSLIDILLRNILNHVNKIPFQWYIIGVPCVNKKNKYYYSHRLANWIVAIAKIAIIQSRWNKANGPGIHCALMLFKSKIKVRINIELSFALLVGKVDQFHKQWNVNNSLCTIIDSTIQFKL